MDGYLFQILLFWGSLLALFHTFAGYPLLVAVLARWRSRPIQKAYPGLPPLVSVVLVAHNEAARIVARLENLRSADYPPDRLEIIVVSDGSTDDTAKRVISFSQPGIRLVELPVRRGKAVGLNAGFAAAHGELVILADARQTFDRPVIRELVANFQDPQVGAVSGELLIESAATAVGGGVDAYWRLEKLIRKSESAFNSVIGCTGAIYAIRRSLYRELPDDTILDDVVVPMRIVLAGQRVIFESAAICRDPQATDPDKEKLRKRRTLAGNFQMLFRHPAWLFPWNNPVWWQLICHKYLRLTAPVFLLTLLVANAFLARQPFYCAVLCCQGTFYFLAVLGMILRSVKLKFLSIPAGFVFLNAMTISGLWYYLGGSYKRGWAASPDQPVAQRGR